MSGGVVVVGAGVVGLCTAHRLRGLGLDVTVVDRGEVGRGATWGNAGWLVPSLAAPLAAPGAVRDAARALLRADGAVRVSPLQALRALPWLARFARQCTAQAHLAGLRATAELARGCHDSYGELLDEGVAFELRRDGLLAAFLDEDRAAASLRALTPLADLGQVLPQLQDGASLRALEPALSEGVGAGYLLADEQAVDPATLVTGLRTSLVADGVTLLEHWSVTKLETRQGRVVAVRGVQESLPCDHVVVAAGAWSDRVLRTIGVRVPLQAGKGYGLTLRTATPVGRALYFPEGRIGASPRRDGLRVAGVMDLQGLQERLDPRRAASVQRVAARYLTDAGAASPYDVWCGLRSVAPDGLPVIGRLPGHDNVTVGFGHAMLGVTLGPVTGRVLADLVVGRSSAVPIEAFRPDRFATRGPAAPRRISLEAAP